MHSLTPSLTHSPPFLVIPSLYTSFPSNPSPSGQSLLIWCISFLLIPSHNPFQLHFYHCWFGGGLSDTLPFSLNARGLPHTMHVSLSKSIMGLRFTSLSSDVGAQAHWGDWHTLLQPYPDSWCVIFSTSVCLSSCTTCLQRHLLTQHCIIKICCVWKEHKFMTQMC